MIARLFKQTFIFNGLIAVVLLASAGTLRWPAAWVFLVTMIILGIGGGLWLAKINPALLTERMKPTWQKDQPAADKVFVIAFGLAAVIWLVVMGLDARFQSSHVPAAIQGLGYVLLVLAVVFSMWVMQVNSFAAAVVKVQTERGHQVISGGPYAFVRHPMYSGVIVFFAGMALLLGSWWGLAMVPLLAVLFAVRTAIEERTLVAGLPGYVDYTARVRYRLLPGVW